ncbi:MAG: histidinol dehydrogenase [Prevotellaceae bacterium]|jgi:histidinol dehydrogenase|nr:histidinol dehydrogenase [Prevotellaceae bacterium]
MQIIQYPKTEQWEEIAKRPAFDTEILFAQVETILNRVRVIGDAALFDYEHKFDKVVLKTLEVSKREIEEAMVSRELEMAIRKAHHNITVFHTQQRVTKRKMQTTGGVTCWQKSVGIEKVGIYVPGGTAPLLSTVLMLAVPAKIAQCAEVILCTPPDRMGNVHPAILFAAQLAGVNRVFKVGGAQAIAAMAYGTQSIPQVYKIFGPGNQYVTAAKQLVGLRDVAIDMPAGPSEVLVIADATAHPDFIAADLLSQAEHGADSQAVLVTDAPNLLKAVATEIDKQVEKLPRQSLAKKSLEHCKLILVSDMQEAIAFSNYYAPEHLIIQMDDYEAIEEKVINAGSVFLGHWSPESVGDYASGTNHTLPTNAYARMYSGVNVDSFVRKITFQHLTPAGLANAGKIACRLADTEELEGHKRAVTIRMKSQHINFRWQ